MKIPLLKGVYTNEGMDFGDVYPRNLMPVVQGNGISDWYLRPAPGIINFTSGPTTPDRGGINWLGKLFRVYGAFLVEIDKNGVVQTRGSFAGATTGQVTLDYSFDRLAIAVSGNMYYWNGSTLTQVTDPDLGTVIDMVWVDGYFMTTDGTNLVVTELNDPFAVNPLKYGSSEADSDPVVALLKLKNEVYALNRHTIEVFDNVGGALFPFARIEGAQIQKGCIGTHACTVFMDAIAFIGGGRNEPPLVYIGSNSQAIKISTREIDKILAGYGESILAQTIVETRTDKDHALLYIHLPDQTLVYDGSASRALSSPVWTILMSSVVGKAIYKARNFVWVYDRWICGDPTSARVGILDETRNTHYGETIGWEFSTPILYNDGKGGILHSLELVCLPGRESAAALSFGGVVGAGGRHTLARSSSGTLWAWGHNGNGQVGDGTVTPRTSPVQIGALTNWAAVSGGFEHSLALKSDGTLWAWGLNTSGQLGDGTNTQRTSPTQIGALTTWATIAGAIFHSLAVKTDGTLWAWGANGTNELGDGTIIARNAPVPIGAATTWSKVAGGTGHSLATRTDGTLWAWGDNGSGQVGDGTTTQRAAPVQIGALTNWASVSGGTSHSVALKTDGTVWAWGFNGNGQVGDGTTTQRNSPVQSLSGCVAAVCGSYHGLAIKSNGTLWAWGLNNFGQLGDGTNTQRNSPVQVGSATNWATVSAKANQSFATQTDGTVWAWGYGVDGALGDGTNVSKSSPTLIGLTV